ncbi:hypothetical protein KNP414_01125 [Paenibacillus mucilaginosus KNP414]|uniref:Uncharacterized protein n=1 Tax=Paenibacillus mucilaginosus (strain KNP414) TaxID=1036673 RepID=F8FEZ3_PAEMK|nr:hypothetical protein KNP414_01125 [Paenibacillus mucilaginosus KNP414]
MGSTRITLQPGELIEVHYEEEDGEMQLQARFVEYQIFTEGRAGVVFIRVESEDGKDKTWINLDTVKSIRRIGPGN